MKAIAENSIWYEYDLAVRALEFAGLCRSDAQAAIDIEFNAFYGKGWDKKKENDDE